MCSRLVDGRLLVKIRSGGGAGRGEGPIKRVMGRRDQATNPAPAPGAADQSLQSTGTYSLNLRSGRLLFSAYENQR